MSKKYTERWRNLLDKNGETALRGMRSVDNREQVLLDIKYGTECVECGKDVPCGVFTVLKTRRWYWKDRIDTVNFECRSCIEERTDGLYDYENCKRDP